MENPNLLWKFHENIGTLLNFCGLLRISELYVQTVSKYEFFKTSDFDLNKEWYLNSQGLVNCKYVSHAALCINIQYSSKSKLCPLRYISRWQKIKWPNFLLFLLTKKEEPTHCTVFFSNCNNKNNDKDFGLENFL